MPVLSAVNPPTVEQASKLTEQGVRFLLFGSDVALISSTFHSLMRDVVSRVKESPSEA
jgi:2-keto-3-deoxy-L-rhamnonate aldolase RhmA